MNGWAESRIPILKSGLEVLGVEALGVEAVAEGVGVARLCSAVQRGGSSCPERIRNESVGVIGERASHE